MVDILKLESEHRVQMTDHERKMAEYKRTEESFNNIASAMSVYSSIMTSAIIAGMAI